MSATNEEGIALPMAMIFLAILTALLMAFASLSVTEPVIANNHSTSATARALAESGVERALWALSSSTIIPGAQPWSAPAPYDGSTRIALGAGEFTVQATQSLGSPTNEVQVIAVGCIPDCSNTTNTRKKIQVTATRLPTLTLNNALAGNINLQVDGAINIDSRARDSNGNVLPGAPTTAANFCTGTTATDGAVVTGSVSIDGSSTTWGAGAPTPNVALVDYIANPPTSSIPAFTNNDLLTLKAYAQSHNTYFQGNQTWNASNPPPAGLVFVDTTNGAALTASTPSNQKPIVTLSGTFTWNGIMVINGDLSSTGTPQLNGLVYVVGASTDNSTTGNITGALVIQNVQGVDEIEFQPPSSTSVLYHCPCAKTGNGTVSSRWFTKSLTYTEISG